jgi:hypothetical protein
MPIMNGNTVERWFIKFSRGNRGGGGRGEKEEEEKDPQPQDHGNVVFALCGNVHIVSTVD